MKACLFILLAVSASAATLDVRRAPTEQAAWRMAREYAASVPAPRVWAVASTGSMWPLVQGGDIVVMQAGFPKPGEIGAFHFVPTAAQRAAGFREGYRMHEYLGTENGYAIFTPSVTPTRPYPIRERVPVSEVIGVIRVAWRTGK